MLKNDISRTNLKVDIYASPSILTMQLWEDNTMESWELLGVSMSARGNRCQKMSRRMKNLPEHSVCATESISYLSGRNLLVCP